MCADTNPSTINLRTLLGNLAEAVEHASPEDLLVEAKASGENTEQIAAEIKKTLLAGVQSFEQRHLHSARTIYRKRSNAPRDRRFIMPGTPAERLKLLMDMAIENKRVAIITAQYRDLEMISDDDVRSALEDLMELGAFDEISEQENDGND